MRKELAKVKAGWEVNSSGTVGGELMCNLLLSRARVACHK